MGYVDVHSHIIPGVDDGPDDIELSKRMLQASYDAGFTTIIATPHCCKGFRKYSLNDVIELCLILNEYAQEHISRDFQVLPGQEIYFNEESLRLINSEQVLPIARGRYVLLEFDPGVSYSHMRRAIREVSMSSYQVVLAHFERYECLYDFNNIRELRSLGILLQMNYSDIGGSWFNKSTKFCRKCLINGYVDFLGTDMHDDASRGPHVKRALKWMKNHLDEEYLKAITEINAKSILNKDKG